MSRWLVTGGAGFIGSHIVEKLVKDGQMVRVFDDFSSGKEEYIKDVIDRVEIIKADIRDDVALKKSTEGVDYVLHQAAMRSVPRSVQMPLECNAINVEGTLKCLKASFESKVKKFVLASSSSIYGDSDKFPQKESDSPQPLSPYAVSKLTGEHYCHVYSKTYGMPTASLRYFNVYGPRQDPKSKYSAVIPKFIISALKGEPLEIHWDGKQSRDFSYVGDVVQANILAAKSTELKNEVFNVACNATTSLLDIVNLLEKEMGKKLEKTFSPKREGDVRKTYASIDRSKKDLKFKPETSFDQGFKNTFDFFSKNNQWQKY